MDARTYEGMSLRERKKAMIRDAILSSAERLFEERGYDNVTVAEIADAANVSVKTLFVYFRSKEDLAFADTALLDGVLAALRSRPPGTSPAYAVGRFLRAAAEGDQQGAGLEGYHRAVGESDALRSRLLRMWADYEDAVTEALAVESGTTAAPHLRLAAAQLVAIVRSLTSPEVRAAVAEGRTGRERQRILNAWIDSAVRQVDAGLATS